MVKDIWIEEEIEYLEKNLGKLSPQEMAKTLNRTLDSVVGKIRRLKEHKTIDKALPSEFKKSIVPSLSTEEFIATLKELVSNDYLQKRFPLYKQNYNKEKSKEILNLVISDMHIGKVNEWYDTRNNQKIITYNNEIRLDFQKLYLESVMRLLTLWKNGYYFEALNVFLLGDIVDNDRIFEGQKNMISMPVGKQIWSAIAELADMINILSKYFPETRVKCVVGNHGRSVTNAREEEPVENNFEYHLYRILGMTLEGNSNIKVDIPDSRFYSVDNYGHKIFMSHGETIKGYTTSYAERKAKELLINLPDGYNLYIIGHRHRSDRIALSPNAELLVNGCWIPHDDYAFKLYGTSTQPCQWLFGSSKKRVISSLAVPIDFR